ncbi:Fic family protein [bacterium]|nr:Fic family protein [bacterium]
MFQYDKPYNDLPLLPPRVEIEEKEVLKKAISAGRQLAELKGLTYTIPNPEILINTLTLQEARISSEIENVWTTNEHLLEAFSSTTQTLDAHTKEVLRYREALWDGYEILAKRQILSTNLYVKIYQIIKKTTAGIRTTPGTKIINSRNEIIYTPPEGFTVINDKLKNLEMFIHSDGKIDDLIKCALIHYQFEAIHPFTDGNGRTGRIINALFLVLKNRLNIPVLYLSDYIIKNKEWYYKLIRNVTEKNDWKSWILYFLDAIEETATSTAQKIIEIKNLFNETLGYAREKLPAYMYSKELVELLFEKPYCKAQFLVEKNIAQRQRAAVYLKELEKIGILKSKKVGRENLFQNIKLYELLKSS